MLSNQVPFEYDKNCVFMRKHELSTHHGKLYSIKNRKNDYTKVQFYFKPSRFSQNGYKSEEDLNINKVNTIMCNKLSTISNRDNKALLGNEPFEKYIVKKNKAMCSINYLGNKAYEKFQDNYHKRIFSIGSVVDVKKMEKDFQVTRGFTHLRKIHPNRSAANIFTSYGQFIINSNKKTISTGKTKVNTNSKSNENNINKEDS